MSETSFLEQFATKQGLDEVKMDYPPNAEAT